MTPEKVDKPIFDALQDIASGKYDAVAAREMAKAAIGGFLTDRTGARRHIMSDEEYEKKRAAAMTLINSTAAFDAWRFKHEARTRGEKQLGLLVWALHLAASDF